MRVTVIAACLATLPGFAAAQGGSITGVVTTHVAAPRAVRVTVDPRVCGTEVPDESILVSAGGRVANAVVTLVGVKASTPPTQVTVMNEHCRFVPRVQVARPNGEVRTSSRDAVLHTTTVQTPAGRPLFSVALPVPGISLTKTLGAAGVARITCNTHPWMRGWLFVTDDVAAVTSTDGTFSLTGVPPGTYELRVWHEALRGAGRQITVRSGTATTVTFELR